MKRYVALLRGINVGGHNKISMPELKQYVAELGFYEVKTYLNSGNLIFSSELTDVQQLSDMIRQLIKEKFALSIPVHTLSQEDLQEQLAQAPDWWGTGDKTIYDNLIFMMDSLTYDDFLEKVGDLAAAYEQAENFQQVIFWSYIRKDYQKTNWWTKTANPKIKDHLTIRTANTVRKISEM